MDFDAIVLAGGRSRRMGGSDKTTLTVGGATLLDRVLAAVAGAATVVVVGDQRPLAASSMPVAAAVASPVLWAREEPVGGGPVAALAAALPMVGAPRVLLMAADMPFLSPAVAQALLAAIAPESVGPGDGASAGDGSGPLDGAGPLDRAGPLDGAVAGDEAGAPQWLCGAWETAALRRLVAARGGVVEGLSLRALFAEASYAIIGLDGDGPPWFDCDTPQDLARAKELG